MTRVMIVDDHALVRQGLAALLAATDDLQVVASAPDGSSAARTAAAARPDVVLMDLSMPVMDGVQATRALLASCPTARVVVLTSFGEHSRIREALSAGAIGYLLKDAEPADVLRAVRGAAAGGAPLSPRAALALLPGSQPSGGASPSSLTAREQEVLRLVATGLPNKSVARRLEISEKTVKAHLTRIFAALGVADRTSAALWAQRHGML